MTLSHRTPAKLITVYDRVIWPAHVSSDSEWKDALPALSIAYPASFRLRVLKFIQDYHAAHDMGPTPSEVSAAVGCSKCRVMIVAKQLARDGYLLLHPDKKRGTVPIRNQAGDSSARGRRP